MIDSVCPHCQGIFQVPDECLGQSSTCIHCGFEIKIHEAAITCSRCKKRFSVPAALRGRTTYCPHCTRRVRIHGRKTSRNVSPDRPLSRVDRYLSVWLVPITLVGLAVGAANLLGLIGALVLAVGYVIHSTSLYLVINRNHGIPGGSELARQLHLHTSILLWVCGSGMLALALTMLLWAYGSGLLASSWTVRAPDAVSLTDSFVNTAIVVSLFVDSLGFLLVFHLRYRMDIFDVIAASLVATALWALCALVVFLGFVIFAAFEAPIEPALRRLFLRSG